MRHLKSGSKLGRNPWHRRATLRNLVTNLLEHGRITTTLTRAKATRPVAEKMITLGKRDTLQSRRQAAAYIMTPAVTKKLFSEIAPKFADRAWRLYAHYPRGHPRGRWRKGGHPGTRQLRIQEKGKKRKEQSPAWPRGSQSGHARRRQIWRVTLRFRLRRDSGPASQARRGDVAARSGRLPLRHVFRHARHGGRQAAWPAGRLAAPDLRLALSERREGGRPLLLRRRPTSSSWRASCRS